MFQIVIRWLAVILIVPTAHPHTSSKNQLVNDSWQIEFLSGEN